MDRAAGGQTALSQARDSVLKGTRRQGTLSEEGWCGGVEGSGAAQRARRERASGARWGEEPALTSQETCV